MIVAVAAVAGMIGLAWPGAAGATSVRVGPGMNLSQIAHTYGTSVNALVADNGIADPNRVLAGAILQIPVSGTPGSGAATLGGSTTVVVAPGDNLWAIAARFGTTVAALVKLNGITDSNHVLAGTHLLVPERSTAISAPESGGEGPLSALVGSSTYPAALAALPERLALLPIFQQWAGTFGVPGSLLEAMCWWESGWQMSVVSPTGAMGVGQLEPSTVATLRVALGDQSLDPTRTSDNIEMAAAYLHQLLTQTGGDESLALAGYYQGLASVRQSGMLASTVQYVHGILATTALFS